MSEEPRDCGGQRGLSMLKYGRQLPDMARYRLENMFKVEVKMEEAKILSMCKIE